jgi:hypothetical protein
LRPGKLAVLVVALLLFSIAPVLQARADTVQGTGFNIVGATWGSSAVPTEVGAGSQDVPLTVTAQYYFTNAATGMVATLSLPAGFTDLNGGSTPSAYISGLVQSGAVVQFVFYLDVSTGTPVGTYTFPITFTWGAQTGTNSVSVSQQSSLVVHMNGKVKMTFEATPTSITPGALNDVRVMVTNNGSGPASQISVVVSTSQLLSVLNSFPDLNSLEANSSQTETLQVYAPSTSAGTPVAISFTATYTDAYGTPRSVTQTIGLFVAPLPTTSPVGMSLSTTSLQAGRVNNFTVTLSDQGTAPIDGLSATFSFVGGQVTWLSPDIIQTLSLEPGGTITVQARAYDPATSAGSTTLQGILRYSYQNITVQETRSLGLLSRGLIDIELTGSTVLPQQVPQGQIVSITLTITNVGVIAASAVTAEATMPAGFQAIGTSSNFVGDMEVDSPSTFTLSALVSNSTAPGTFQVPVTLAYFDNLRTPLSQTVDVSVDVVSSSSSGSGTSQSTASSGRGGGLLSVVAYALVIVIAAAIVIVYLRRRGSSRTSTR